MITDGAPRVWSLPPSPFLDSSTIMQSLSEPLYKYVYAYMHVCICMCVIHILYQAPTGTHTHTNTNTNINTPMCTIRTYIYAYMHAYRQTRIKIGERGEKLERESERGG